MRSEHPSHDLYGRHKTELNLDEPVVFETEADFLSEYAAPAKSALVFLPKSKALIDMALALVSAKVVEDGTVVLAGANDSGIRSARDAYEKNIGPVEKKIVGNHSALYVGKNRRLGAEKRIEDFLSFFSLSYSGTAGSTTIEVASLPGVFSADELDAGTRFFLDHIPYKPGRVLDVGCGAGVIGALYKKLVPESEIIMTDSNPLAVIAAKKTCEKNGLDANVVVSDVFSDVDGRFDLIVSNPPFHKGIGTDYSFMDRFAAEAAKHLASKGEAWIVANSFLPYEKILEAGIGPTTVVADNGKFKVCRSRKIS